MSSLGSSPSPLLNGPEASSRIGPVEALQAADLQLGVHLQVGAGDRLGEGAVEEGLGVRSLPASSPPQAPRASIATSAHEGERGPPAQGRRSEALDGLDVMAAGAPQRSDGSLPRRNFLPPATLRCLDAPANAHVRGGRGCECGPVRGRPGAGGRGARGRRPARRLEDSPFVPPRARSSLGPRAQGVRARARPGGLVAGMAAKPRPRSAAPPAGSGPWPARCGPRSGRGASPARATAPTPASTGSRAPAGRG